jgi:plastocyanin
MIFVLLGLSAVAADPPKGVATIRIESFMFNPQSLTIAAGTTVTWTNLDEDVHTVKSDTGLFKSGGMDTNQQFSYRFDVPGTYHFTCSLHPQMVGTIIVQ